MEPKTKLSPREKAALMARYLRGVWPRFALAIGFACLGMALNALTPQIIRLTVDSILGDKEAALAPWLLRLIRWETLKQEPMRALWAAAAAVLAVALVRGVCGFFQRTELSRGSEGYVKAIRDDLYRHIQRLPFAWHKSHPTGDIIQRCTSDVDVIRQFVCSQLVEVVRTVFLIVLYVWIMMRMSVRLTLIALLFIPLISVSSCVFYSKIASRFQEADEAEGDLTVCAQENLTGVRVVRAFGREAFEEEKFEKKNRHFSALWIHLGKLLAYYWASGTLMTCLQVMVIVIAGTAECVAGRMTLGDFVAFVSYNESLSWPVRALGRVLSEMSKAGVSMDRVGEILRAREEQDPEDAVPVRIGDIVFDHVTFGYEGQPVLKDVSFTLPEGKTLGILGGTGSGKSTLVQLLDRLYDLPEGGGRITIGGVDIRRLRRSELRRAIGLVLQEPFLFSKTIGENIKAARPGADRAELRRAAEIACVDEAISSFPEGYETLVGERGVTLSGGQKQRVAIARMLLQQAPIMIFDDSLSAVDAETDAKIRAALQTRLGRATVILISHRIGTLMQADQILVLENGRVSQKGTHAQLIAQPGIYQEIYNIQLRADDRAQLMEGGDC